MKKFFSNVFDKLNNFFKSEFSISGALVGYSTADKIRIIDTYNCYGIDAILKYLN